MTTWITADEHYGHKNIIEYCERPFADSEAMRVALIDRHNAVVQDEDETIHVGDFAMDEALVAGLLALLKGRHVLVFGNHDRCHPCRKHHEAAQRRYLEYGFTSVVESLLVEGMLVHHMPYCGDARQKYHAFRPADEGRTLLHGHVHGLWKVKGRMVNVGVDQWGYAPVRLDEVVEFARARGLPAGTP